MEQCLQTRCPAKNCARFSLLSFAENVSSAPGSKIRWISTTHNVAVQPDLRKHADVFVDVTLYFIRHLFLPTRSSTAPLAVSIRQECLFKGKNYVGRNDQNVQCPQQFPYIHSICQTIKQGLKHYFFIL